MSLKLEQKFGGARPRLDANCGVQVTQEIHDMIKDVSDKTGLRMKETVDMLMRYALESIEWEDK